MRKSEGEEAALLAAVGMDRLTPPKRASKVSQYVALGLFMVFLIGLGILVTMAFQIGPAVLEAVCR